MKEFFPFKESRIRLTKIIRSDAMLVFFILLSFSLMVVVSYLFVSSVVEKQIFTNTHETLSTAEANIHSDLREAEVALLQVEMMIANWLKWDESYDEIREYLAMLARDLVADESWVKGFMNVYGVINGQSLTGIYGMPTSDYVAEKRPWYLAADTANGKVGISPPYTDWETGKLVISLAKAMYDSEGNRYGTIALDIDFSIISSYIVSLHSSKDGYGLLCDDNFAFVVHPFRVFIGRKLDDVNQTYSEIAAKLRSNPGTMLAERFTNEMDMSVVLICRQIFNGWYMGIVTPVSSYYHDVNTMAIVLSVLGFVFMIILSMIVIRLSMSKALSDEQNQGKSSFLARMSHEIRTPMNSILGMAELIRRKAVTSDIKEYIEIIHQSGNTLLAIINDILDFSKIESGRLQIQNREYEIASVVNDMINMMRPKIAEKSLDFFVDVDSSLPAFLYGDDMRLRQILTNLLSNAVKYTQKGFVSLDIRKERSEGNTIKLICLVCDSGIGIKPEDKGQLFNEFVRVNDKVNQGIEGTGLGLVITSALCRAMNGEVTVSSVYGKGSVFKAVITQEIRLDEPVAAVKNAKSKRVLFHDWRFQYVESISNALNSLGVFYKCSQEYSEFIKDLEYGDFDYAFVTSRYAMDCIFALGRRTSPLQLVIMAEPGEMSIYHEVTSIMMPVYSITLANILNNESRGTLSLDKGLGIKFTAPTARILIVDDISTNLRVAKELMAPYNMNIHTCMSGSEALRLVQQSRYDLVFMDHMMPGMDGIEASAFIRGLETGDGYYQNLPIIALTANAVTGQREMFLEHDINDFLAKPIDVQKLNDILEQWLPKNKLKRIVPEGQEDSKDENNEPPVIEGLDTNVGLRNCGGSVSAYLSILEDFCRDAEARLSEISKAFSNKDIRLYITLVHALKGAARSVGAVEMGEAASWLEETAGGGDFDLIRDKNDVLQDNVRIQINNIKTAMESYKSERGNESVGITELKLLELKKALSDMDIKAVNRILLDYAELPMDSDTREIISEVEQLILMFEYDKAIEKIDEQF